MSRNYIKDLDAIRVTAIANNAPVSYGALGVPIIFLAGVDYPKQRKNSDFLRVHQPFLH